MLGHSHVLIGCSGVLVAESLARSHGVSLLDAPLEPLKSAPAAIPNLPFVLASAAVGSLLPDIDHPRSAIANYRMVGVPVLKPAALVASAVLPHRGPTHSLLAWVLLTVLGWLVGSHFGLLPVVAAGSLGYLLHLVADSLTKSGVPWLWPLWRRPLGFPPVAALRLTTGGIVEHVLVIGGLTWALAATGVARLPVF